MKKYLLMAISVLCFGSAFAAKGKDSLFVNIREDRAMVLHEVKKGENLYSIAELYSVPAIVLSQNNDITFSESLETKRKLYVPMGSYNYSEIKPSNYTVYKPVYYKAQPRDSYAQLSKNLNVPESFLRGWNNGIDFKTAPNKTLLMGWVIYKYSDAQSQNSEVVSAIVDVPAVALAPGAVVPVIDTPKGPKSELEMIYDYQTSNQTYLDSLSGMVVFFKPQTTVNNKLLYAFSNDISKGRVLKIVNPSNGKFIYAKVIGVLPKTKQYINAKIGLDGRARAELETREVKLWCDFFFKY